MITAATQLEWQRIHDNIPSGLSTGNDPSQISFHTSGIGVMSTTYALLQLALQQPDFILQVGIAGAFNAELSLGEVVMVKDDCQCDLVVEENGTLNDMFDLNLKDADAFPFRNKKLVNDGVNFLKHNLKQVNAVTVSEITTQPKRVEQLQQKYGAAIETMEGAALHYVCLQQRIPFLQIKAISNYVGERDKSKWKIKEALENLNAEVQQYLILLKEQFTLQQIEQHNEVINRL